MASVSLQVLNSGLTQYNPDSITTGTAAPTTANAIEVRIDVAGSWNLNEIKEALDSIYKRLIDGRFTQGGSFVVPGV